MHSPSSGDFAAMVARTSVADQSGRIAAPEQVDLASKLLPQIERLSGIDAARGIAMILVCLSHIRYHFQDMPEIYALLTYVTRIATPTFLLLSGFVAAHVLSSERNNARLAVVDRALCVLIVGHLLLNIEELPRVGLNAWLFARVTVTDAIAISLIIGALCVRLRTSWLLAVGTLLAVGSWPVAINASTNSSVGHYLLVLLFDIRSNHSDLIDAAIAPYLGVFLVGMAISKGAAHLIGARQHALLARRLFTIGIVAICSVLLAALAWHVVKGVAAQILGSAETMVWIRQTLNPMQKLPPSPAYLVFYGGAGLVIAGACLARRPRALLDPVVNWAATIGRASLMVFVTQDWLLRSVPVLLGFDHLSNNVFWIAYLIVVVLLLHWLAGRWDTMRANRLLTVGLKKLSRRRKARDPRAPMRSMHGAAIKVAGDMVDEERRLA
jgi:uncharacterized membrane protein